MAVEHFPTARRYSVADIQVSREAVAAKPKVIANIIKKAKRPLLITGGQLLKDEKLVEIARKFAEKGIQIAATAGSSKVLIEKGVKPVCKTYTLHQITQFLLDDEFKGFDGKGKYDVVIFLGFIPYYLSRMLSALKHFSDVTTIAIEEFYHPHANFSFTNLTKDKEMYYSMLEEVLKEYG
ncbi:MAG: CO dehydrogenase/acetyl-CoA synthase complex subunit epsilon [Archaeoglobaceae archaeon]|nr:CO dehydrogenase/acetyl-CoA synthase complex subunit epsilon [Archaeoglobaceae archaeon]MCX8151961.1 CO dehydrogenase/acetyl-CoA synthase complex subunit epsilon [Archaeoglobaceae archaeon]MDW8013350.1 CO dehydrogenase/acetyl-CoA synthase complex subunit epsilon [Archaeoglobaceae archaeon]